MEFKLQDSEKNTSFFDPYMSPGIKLKIQKPYCTSERHTLSYPRVSFAYYFMKFRWSFSGKPYTIEKVIFPPHMTQGSKMKIPNPYCTSTRHAQSYPRVSIVYF